MARMRNNKRSEIQKTGEEVLDNAGLKLVVVAACKVCQSPNRHNVDLLLAQGMPSRKIAEALSAAGEDISYRSVARHGERHLSLEHGQYHMLAERRSKEVQEQVAKGAFHVMASESWLDLFIQKSWDRLILGQLEFEARDTINAIKLREELKKEGIGVLEEQMAKELQAIIIAVRERVPEELHQGIADRAREILEGDTLKQLQAPTLSGKDLVEEIVILEGGELDDSITLRQRDQAGEEDHVLHQSEVFSERGDGRDEEEYGMGDGD